MLICFYFCFVFLNLIRCIGSGGDYINNEFNYEIFFTYA